VRKKIEKTKNPKTKKELRRRRSGLQSAEYMVVVVVVVVKLETDLVSRNGLVPKPKNKSIP
jgi:hypothetical protein